MTLLAWTIFAFLCGALPFSYWLGRLVMRTDIRHYGDGNPGATNVIRAGGKKLGALAAALDGLKGMMPVGLAYFGYGFAGWEIVLIAIAPIIGHAFSPFLRFRGGKAVAVTFGIWAGLTLWQAPIILGLALLVWVKLVRASGWAVMLALLTLLLYLLLLRPESALLLVAMGNILILAWKHRADLAQSPGLRHWLRNMKPLWNS